MVELLPQLITAIIGPVILIVLNELINRRREKRMSNSKIDEIITKIDAISHKIDTINTGMDVVLRATDTVFTELANNGVINGSTKVARENLTDFIKNEGSFQRNN